jgi:hypothetical protein
MKRYTIKELQDMTDREFIMAVLDERASKCTNVYAPLSQRIHATRTRLQYSLDALPEKGYLTRRAG